MSDNKTHWKKLTNPNYLGAYSLDPGQELVATIESVTIENVKGADGKEEQCTVAYLKGHKPIILNKTNCKAITKAYGTPYIEEWAGAKVVIFAKKVRAFGEWVEALRIKPEQPKKETLTKDHPKYNSIVEALKGGYTIDQVKTKYDISKQLEAELCKK